MLQKTLQQAVQLHQAGRLAEAERLYAQLLSQAPQMFEALHLMGLVRLQQNRLDEAVAFMEQALKLRPGAPETLTNYGLALVSLGRPAEALPVLEQVASASPGNVAVRSNIGGVLQQLGRSGEALAVLDQALAIAPRDAGALTNRGLVLQALDRTQEAVESFTQALAVQPASLQALNGRGLAYRALNRHAEALADFESILRSHPGHLGAQANRAATLWALGRVDDALAGYDAVLAVDPNMVDALASRANLLWTAKMALGPALADTERLAGLAPDHPGIQGDLLHMRLYAGDWRDFDDVKAALDAGVRAGRSEVDPFVYQGLCDNPADLLACAKIHAMAKYPAQPPLCAAGAKRQSGRIRLGYISGEFRTQATAHLTAGLYEHHDRARFEVIAFDNSRREQSPMRARLERGFDRMIDITALSDAEAAARVAAEGIDILVNLNGYFGRGRTGVFAHRPAPVQVNYLGFPGTLGASYMDYILADAVVIPPGEEAFYTETVMRLPHSYQVNDNRRGLLPAPSRAALGLSEGAFVFCHFNYSYKILPAMFASWMRILAAAPDSVLWLLKTDDLFEKNLRAAAHAACVDADRLIFAPQLPVEQHVARLAAGDLFLDSLPYGAHTTGSDALWAGLPLLTCRGRAFAGRVGASLLTALGLPELIAEDREAYETMAVALARDPARLAALRGRLAANRSTTPLFDTAASTRAIEAAYETMMARVAR